MPLVEWKTICILLFPFHPKLHQQNFVIKPDYEFHWQDAYGVFSFGEKSLPVIVGYIQNQKQHHADGTLITAMEQMDER